MYFGDSSLLPSNYFCSFSAMEDKRIGANIRRIREGLRMSMSELARRSGVNKGNLSRVERGRLGISLEKLHDVALALNLRDASILLQDESNVAMVPSQAHKLPILSWQQAGSMRVSGPQDGPMQEYALFNITASAETFALRIENDSMSPRLNVGDIIAVDPKKEVTPGCLVVAQVGDSKLLRQYRELGHQKGKPVFELVPLNPLYAARRSDKEKIKIIGVATHTQQTL